MPIFLILLFLLSACNIFEENKVSVEVSVARVDLDLSALKSAEIEAFLENQYRTLEVVAIPSSADSPYKLQGLLFYPYQYPLPAAKSSYESIGVAIDESGRKFTARNFLPTQKFKHPRHTNFFDLDRDGLVDIIVSDHGHDEEPFEGGEVKIFFQRPDQTYELASFTAPLGYWFSSCSKNFGPDQTLSLLVTTGTEQAKKASGPLLISIDKNRKITHHKIPAAIANSSSRHYLSCAFIGENRLLLGPMDSQKLGTSARDFLFEYDLASNRWEELELPTKNQDFSRGTIELKNFAQKEGSEFIYAANSHDSKLSRGLIELTSLKNLIHVFDPHDSTVRAARDYFIPRFHLVDLDGNGLNDILFYTGQTGSEFDPRAKSTIHLYLQTRPNTFVDVSNSLPNHKDLIGLSPIWFEQQGRAHLGLLYIYGPREMELFSLKTRPR